MRSLSHLGSPTNTGGSIISTPVNDVFVNNQPVCVQKAQSVVEPGPPVRSVKSPASPTVFAGRKPMAGIGDPLTSGSVLVGGSPDVFIG